MEHKKSFLPALRKEQIALTASSLATSGVLDLLAHGDKNIVFFGLLGTFAVGCLSDDLLKRFLPNYGEEHIIDMADHVVDAVLSDNSEADQSPVAKLKRIFGIRETPVYEPKLGTQDELGASVEQDVMPLALAQDALVEEQQEQEGDVFSFDGADAASIPGLSRLSVQEIVSHIPRNQYCLFIGRSLTDVRYRPIGISFKDQHLKLIGASQKGKSSMAACLLEIITQTHDPDHLMIALLDLENKTSRLFANSPHLAEMTIGHKNIPLHAKSPEEVLECLKLIVQLMDYRYRTFDELEMETQPVLLVYLEEFIQLKNYFKMLARTTRGEAKDKASEDYETLVFCIKAIAARGLKARIQFLVCAQVDYRDEDLAEALINISSGMCFAVKPTAAQAAGFMSADLLAKNYMLKTKVVAVVETPDCRDLVYAPDYDLRARLRDLAAHQQAVRALDAQRRTPPAEPTHNAVVRAQDAQQVHAQNPPYEPRTSAHTEAVRPLAEATHGENTGVRYRLSDAQVEQFATAYRLLGNRDKALEFVGANTRYRDHAREIIVERNLRKEV